MTKILITGDNIQIQVLEDDEPQEPQKQYPPIYSFDPHVHFHGCPTQYTPAELMGLLKKNGVNIASALVWSYFDGWDIDSEEFIGRQNHPVSTDTNILRVDLEISSHVHWNAAKMGHLMGLNMVDIEWASDFDNGPDTLIPIAKWMKNQGATTGMAHCQACSSYPRPGNMDPLKNGYPTYNPAPVPIVPYELPVLAVLGLLDFMEVEAPNVNHTQGLLSTLHPGPAFMWKHLCNAGYPVAMVGGSDFSCLNREYGPGHMRTLVPSHNLAPNYGTALEDIKNQKAVLSTGDVVGDLRLTINGMDNPVFNEDSGGKDRFNIEIFTDQNVDHVDIIKNGDVDNPVYVCPIENGRGIWETFGWNESVNLSARTPHLQTGITQIVVKGVLQRDPNSVAWLRGWIMELRDEVNAGKFGEKAKDGIPYYEEALSKLAL